VSPAKKILFPLTRLRKVPSSSHTARARITSLVRAPASSATSCRNRAVPSTPMGMSVLTTLPPRSRAAPAAAPEVRVHDPDDRPLAHGRQVAVGGGGHDAGGLDPGPGELRDEALPPTPGRGAARGAPRAAPARRAAPAPAPEPEETAALGLRGGLDELRGPPLGAEVHQGRQDAVLQVRREDAGGGVGGVRVHRRHREAGLPGREPGLEADVHPEGGGGPAGDEQDRLRAVAAASTTRPASWPWPGGSSGSRTAKETWFAAPPSENDRTMWASERMPTTITSVPESLPARPSTACSGWSTSGTPDSLRIVKPSP
jgi:hypothetical protein